MPSSQATAGGDMKFTLAALYAFVRVDDPSELECSLRALLTKHVILGNLIVANEGINGTIAGKSEDIRITIAELEKDVRFAGSLEVKYSEAQCQPFYRLRLHIKPEIVTMGVQDIDPVVNRGQYVEPEDWNSLIQQEDVVLIDTRNDYEIGIGTFQNAVNPNTKTFKEFPEYISQNYDPQKDKKVAMFCTGGIRCEKASAYMREKGFEKVYHLKGGVLKYLETVKEENSLWKGECYVFDQRVSVKHNVQPGSYSQCRNCRMPLAKEDTTADNSTYLEGIHCKHCVGSLTDKKRASLEERQRQITLAADNNTSHLGLQLSDIKATRQLKKKKKLSHCKKYECGSLVVITRVHCKSASSLVKIEKIVDFAKSCFSFADKIMVLLGLSSEHHDYYEELINALRAESVELFQKVHVEIITPWIGFTSPLNVGVRLAIDSGYDHVLFQSLEVRVSASEIEGILHFFDEQTLVAGPVLEGHDFLPTDEAAAISSSSGGSGGNSDRKGARVELRGRTCPWNTCAVWRLDKLGIVGFPLIGDGITLKASGGRGCNKEEAKGGGNERVVVPGGVEEVSAIAFAQLVNPQWTAKLIRFDSTEAAHARATSLPSTTKQPSLPESATAATSVGTDATFSSSSKSSASGGGGVQWNTTLFEGDAARKEYHAQKMASKDSRPASQLEVAGGAVRSGHVMHMCVESSV